MKHTPQKKPVAAFDIDGTLFRSSLLIELVEALISEKYFPDSARSYYKRELTNWQNRQGHYDEYMHKVIDVYVRFVKGLSIDEVISVADRVLEFKKDQCYVYTKHLLAELQATHFLVAISHSPFHIVDSFARNLGFEKVYAMWYETNEDGRLTGSIKYEDVILDKGRVLKRILEKEDVSLADSYGVGDSESDIAMLEMVEHPIAFNPTSLLHKKAKKHSWQIVIERKNVTYVLKDGKQMSVSYST